MSSLITSKISSSFTVPVIEIDKAISVIEVSLSSGDST